MAIVYIQRAPFTRIKTLANWSPFSGSGQGVDPQRLAEAFQLGLRTDLRWDQLYVRLYGAGDRIAIATGRLDGWIRLPGGERLTGPWDFRKIWIQDEAGWRMAPDGAVEDRASRSGATLPAIGE